ncbi:MAG TPA: DNA internalization-related competence protein ComEC/Rec2 [Candidatus Acidoferrum sp.]|jgi:competence protein ComEC
MKLPAVAVTAAFACGIVIGLWPRVGRLAASHLAFASLLIVAALLVVFGFLLIRAGRLHIGAGAALGSWLLLGILGAWLAEQPLPDDHVLTLINSAQIDLHSPLRWRGTLRDEPTRLPWGYGYEVALTSVDFQNRTISAQGGMRVTYTLHPGETPPEVRAGDVVAVLTQARQPQVFRDEGAFDRRAYLATQGVDLVATLRAPELMERVTGPTNKFVTLVPRARRRLRDEVDTLFETRPQVAAVLRAMLLGDRSFVDRDEATDFQKTGVFHVLVVAGLHVGALAIFLFWVGRRLRLSTVWTILFTLTVLFAYVAMVEQRAPVLRASLMTAIVVLAGFFYRRLDLLNSAAVAALILLIWRPLAIRDSSFQLTFVSIGCIAGIALPWLERTVQPYVKALHGWRDVTRDVVYEPKAIQFRIDVRSTARMISRRLPSRVGAFAEGAFARGLLLSFRLWEALILTLVLQIGMLPQMTRDFHRVTLAAPVVNLLAVPLTGVAVPVGFLALITGLISPALGKVIAVPLGWVTLLLLRVVGWFAHFPRGSYRIPEPPWWLTLVFFIALVLLAAAFRLIPIWRRRLAVASLGAALSAALVVAIFPFAPRRVLGQLEVSVLDVGQGDSLFVVSPSGRTLLIDGGGAFGGFPGHEEHNGIDPGEEAVSPYLWSRGYQRLDVVALTHAHQDHLGGLTAILNNFCVGRLWVGRDVASPAFSRIEALAREKHIPIEHELQGKAFNWDGVQGDFLWPERSATGTVPAAKNNDSLVLRLRYGSRTILLPGDAEKESERAMLAENDVGALQSDVLKVGHHGSKNSTMPDFLAAVKPRIALISTGEDNPYGHPSPELLERLANEGARILRTDRDGALHLLTDGQRLEITCFVACPEVKDAGTISRNANAPDH